MKVLIACELSGVVRDAFLAKGHEAYSCDVLPSLSPGPHIIGNCLDYLNGYWDIVIAHPPCQYLSYAGKAVWNRPGRRELREHAAFFAARILDCPVRRVCVENPRGYLFQYLGRPQQMIEPFFFGDRDRKKTYLWLKGLPPLLHFPPGSLFPKLSSHVPPRFYGLRLDGKKYWFCEKAHGSTTRSKTFPGIAAAMAAQWT